MIESTETENIAQTIAKEIKQPINVLDRDNTAYIALPSGWTMRREDFEYLLPQPRRKTGQIELCSTESFIEYVKKHGSLVNSAIYCTANYMSEEISFKSILNDHGELATEQQWRDYQALYRPLNSLEWNDWTAINKKPMTQREFAEFVENHLDDITPASDMPTRSELLEMIIKFEATQDSRLKQHVRLQSGGIELNFVNKDDEQTIQKMKMFEKISIGIPVFENDQNIYRIDARLRYRIREGILTFWYELIRADKVLKLSTEQMINEIRSKTGLPFYFGQPNI